MRHSGLPDYKPVSVPRLGAAVIPLGPELLPGSSDLPGSRNGASRSCSPIWSCSAWGLPCRRPLPAPRCALTAPFHPYRAGISPRPAVLFSVALSVKLALSASPRPLAGMLLCGDRTFLPSDLSAGTGDHPSGRPKYIMTETVGRCHESFTRLGSDP